MAKAFTLLAAVVCASMALLLPPRYAFSDVAPQITPLPVREIAPGVYVHQAPITEMNAASGGDIANTGFIVGDDAVAVIDTGGALTIGARLKKAIEAITPKPIRYVINTTEHPDYIFGNAAFVGPGVTFVGHKNLPREMAQRGPDYLVTWRRMMPDLVAGIKLVPPTLLVEPGKDLHLDLGHREIDVRAWPTMSTDCNVTVFDTATATLFTGDLLYLHHVPVIDGSLLGWLKELPAFAKIPAQRIVPGHGPADSDWHEALDAQKAYLAKMTEDLRALLKQGADINTAAKKAAQSEAGKWQLFGVYNPRNATAGYAELEWQ
ncbi:quinoprotein relay system zinc metallohydrolase 2 [Methylovirgula ligni]|uniref:Quinoprotein relay system zinc metallohydrolase 2 n=1 Tax=Methylovirgula ligni TaxID=569860 RepID=A0A3D9ZCZ2_9HYPH|nr:quinoprotein relay system zinc metallohydrolase 2 [Methylovirgula ligni]REF89326.1 quinoprotein relay system zinc metallohydrolase 2 [Methylovirgula ligni]